MTTVPLNDLLDGFTVDPETAPELTVEIEDVVWQNAEPDVGIMSSYADDWTETFFADDKHDFDSRKDYVLHLIEAGVLEPKADEILKLIEDEIQTHVNELEPGE